ncbi:MAG: DUF4113 domain-containing protein, partial [Spirochaetia bacterium]|nr:DUF4113 domain-containing protein [Spirochaetia bacterium]
SAEAKKAGLKRGLPLFQQKQLIDSCKAAVFSSNYTLYADISRRVIMALGELAPSIEAYSIDEAFIEVPLRDSSDPCKIASYGREVKEKVFRYTGIPVSVGIAATKTLAKAANRLAKKTDTSISPQVYIIDDKNRIPSLKAVAVEDVWGIGMKYSLFLRERGIHTAYDFSLMDRWQVKKKMTLTGYRTLMELNGEKQVKSEHPEVEKKAILSSRQFGRPVTELKELLEAVSDYASGASEKLYRQSSSAGAVTVFIETDRHREGEKYYSACRGFTFPSPVSYTPEIIKAACSLVKEIYSIGYNYKRAGVILTGIVSTEKIQKELFEEINESDERKKLQQVISEINFKYGRNTLSSLSRGTGRPEWQMRRQMLSPRYTTDINDFPVVSAV